MRDTCALCGRPLRSAASRWAGIGPHCARKLAARDGGTARRGQLVLPLAHGYARAAGRAVPVGRPITTLPPLDHYQPALAE